ncbi:hypothetical protein [Tersicoccus sp. Bi-70]|uniref:8-oxoguanine DNA glycosylase OGG fold protein n=1 Tax=Tersicoccus sp. Bi-70 TaxID=1897634 RepID=UPI00117FF9AA|nr:hypothetical protein [Tersicoccus sp. Bi-70]
MKTTEEIGRDLDVWLGDRTPPTDATVRAEAFTYSPGQWRRWWPSGLDQPEAVSTSDARRSISRSDLYQGAVGLQTPTQAVELYMRMSGWGCETRPYPTWRAARALSAVGVGDRLLEAHQLVRTGKTAEAFTQMQLGGEYRVKGFGASFFTRWLYFSAYDAWDASWGPAPLILDQRVAATIGYRRWAWSVDEYLYYLDFCEKLQALWRPDEPTHVIEYALFQASKRGLLGVRQLQPQA